MIASSISPQVLRRSWKIPKKNSSPFALCVFKATTAENRLLTECNKDIWKNKKVLRCFLFKLIPLRPQDVPKKPVKNRGERTPTSRVFPPVTQFNFRPFTGVTCPHLQPVGAHLADKQMVISNELFTSIPHQFEVSICRDPALRIQDYPEDGIGTLNTTLAKGERILRATPSENGLMESTSITCRARLGDFLCPIWTGDAYKVGPLAWL